MSDVLILVVAIVLAGVAVFAHSGGYRYLFLREASCGCVLNVLTRRPVEVNRKCEKHGYLEYLE